MHQVFEAFIQDNWASNRSAPDAERRWFQALAAAGWLTPHWLPRHGGTGWSADLQRAWRNRCRWHGCPQPDPLAMDFVAPLLQAAVPVTGLDDYLAGIRRRDTSWGYARQAESGLVITSLQSRVDWILVERDDPFAISVAEPVEPRLHGGFLRATRVTNEVALAGIDAWHLRELRAQLANAGASALLDLIPAEDAPPALQFIHDRLRALLHTGTNEIALALVLRNACQQYNDWLDQQLGYYRLAPGLAGENTPARALLTTLQFTLPSDEILKDLLAGQLEITESG